MQAAGMPGMGAPGGMGGPGMGGPDSSGKPENKQGRVLPVPIYAFVLDDITAVDGTPSQRPEVKLGLLEMGGYGGVGGGMGGMMGGMGGYGGGGYGGGGYVGYMYEGMAGYAAVSGFAQPFLSLGSEAGKQFLQRHNLSSKQAELLQELITQAVLREEAVSVIEVEKGQGKRSEQAEQLLKEVLRENYASRLAQQELQIDKLKEQIANLQANIDRRRQAIDRVADLELARIVLTAQGLIDEKTP